jgi:16S rRNA (adenine1518-N6/adenine1519-N6)-dimethyltransferase
LKKNNLPFLTLSQIKKLLQQEGWAPQKKFGQNFCFDRNILKKIVASLVGPARNILEIGPGLGNLTHELLLAGKKVWAVEIDRSLATYLQGFAGDDLHIFEDDFLKWNLNEMAFEQDIAVVANVPYNITSPIIKKLAFFPGINEIILLIQREVAERLRAKPGTASYGFLTVMASLFFECDYLFKVSKEVFMPKPKVDSAVVRLRRQNLDLSCEDLENTLRLAHIIFQYRRKTLTNALKTAGITPPVQLDIKNIRGETLSVAQITNLARKIFNHN